MTITGGWVSVSLILPVYNEEEPLESSVLRLLEGVECQAKLTDYELVICENGSTDRTLEIARRLAEKNPRTRVESLDAPSYGRALRHGIQTARGQLLVLMNADFWDIGFLQTALDRRSTYDVLIGTKNARGARDQRPFHRRAITQSFNWLLRLFFGFVGTDTHGIKALEAGAVRPIVAQCQTENEIFDTELVLRAQRAGLRIVETPLESTNGGPAAPASYPGFPGPRATC